VDYVKARPGQLNYASFGAGSSAHVAAELFQYVVPGTKMVHVPYNGGGPAALGVATGSVEMLFGSILPVLGLVRGQKLRPIAIASDRRSPLLPDVPTFLEGGIDYRTGTWFGLVAPARTPDAIIAALHKSAVEILNDSAVRDRVIEQGGEVVANTPAEFRDFIKSETDRLAIVIKRANMQLD
jgi:tripartite-type tricarboxylate transporter receptor subunit TctC